MILFQLIKLTSLRYSVSLFIPCDNFNCQRFRAVRCLICHLHDGFTLLLLLPEFFRVFSSRAKLYGFCYLTLSLPERLMEFCKVALTFESVDQSLWCDHSNESSLPVRIHGDICLSKFYKIWKFGRNLPLDTFGSERVK